MMTVDTTELQALRRQLHEARTDIRKNLEEESRRFAPLLVRSAQAHARGEVEKRIAQSGNAKIAKDGFVVTFGRTGRLSGGAKLGEVTRPYEFGTDRQNVKTKPYRSRHRTSGRAMQVSRRTMKQLPRANANGRFIYPAVADVVPRMVSAYVRRIVEAVTHA